MINSQLNKKIKSFTKNSINFYAKEYLLKKLKITI